MPDDTLSAPMRVSFVVPTYRRPDALQSTLAALQQLDYPSDGYEVVVVDDGSGDATADLVGDLAGQDDRIRYHAQPNSASPRRATMARRLRPETC